MVYSNRSIPNKFIRLTSYILDLKVIPIKDTMLYLKMNEKTRGFIS